MVESISLQRGVNCEPDFHRTRAPGSRHAILRLRWNAGRRTAETDLLVAARFNRARTAYRGSSYWLRDTDRAQLALEERPVVLAQVRDCDGNLTQAARRLGIARSTLYLRSRNTVAGLP
jgi:transcriptional regulator of acetoin/glycerol metabolism